MLPGLELMGCSDLAVPAEVMHHVVRVESSYNPFAIGVVGGRLARQPRSLPEAVATMRMLEREDYNYSVGLAQVNRYNLAKQGLASPEQAFDICPNLRAGARILAECYGRAGRDWGKAFSCYYSGNFETGFRHGYVQKVFASWQGQGATHASAFPSSRLAPQAPVMTLVERRIQGVLADPGDVGHAADSSTAPAAPSVLAAAHVGLPASQQAPGNGSGYPAASAHTGNASDGPVRVQAMSAPAEAMPATTPIRRQDDARDAAFVF